MTAHEDKNIYAGTHAADDPRGSKNGQNGQVVPLAWDSLQNAQNQRVELPEGYGAGSVDEFRKHAETLQGSAAGSALGIYTRTASALPDFTKENGLETSQRLARLLRWRRQRMARKLLPKESIKKCCWTRIQPYAEGWKSKTGKPAHMRGIATCGSVSMCPVCAAKIRTHKRNELMSGIAAARLFGWHVVMMTVTIQHDKKNKFETVLGHLIQSVHKLRGRRAWTRATKKFAIRGSVTALEITYGIANGWHPHKHILFFIENELSAAELEDFQNDVYMEYAKIMRLIGRYAKKNVAIDIRAGNDYIADYLLKYGREPKQRTWGIADEMTKAQLKTSPGDDGHLTPFELLDLAGAGQVWAAEKFKEYAECMKGRKVLTWSNHLRELLGLGVELDDKEIAELGAGEDHYPFAFFDWKAWNMAREKVGHVLEDMRVMDFENFKARMIEQGIEIVREEQKTATGKKREPVYNADNK